MFLAWILARKKLPIVDFNHHAIMVEHIFAPDAIPPSLDFEAALPSLRCWLCNTHSIACAPYLAGTVPSQDNRVISSLIKQGFCEETGRGRQNFDVPFRNVMSHMRLKSTVVVGCKGSAIGLFETIWSML